jgi:hypothetical protein
MAVNRLELIDTEPFADRQHERIDAGLGDVGGGAQELDGSTPVAFK